MMGSLSTCIQRAMQRDGQTSLAASVRVLDASLILPEGPSKRQTYLESDAGDQPNPTSVPLGSWNMPFSLPEVIARLSWLAAMLLTSILYFFSTN